MALPDRIQADLTAAMKSRDRETASALRLVLAEIRNLRVAEGHRGEVTDEETVGLLTREAKKRTEAAETYEAAGRADLAAGERRLLEVVRRYLPEQLGAEELGALVDEAIAEAGASGPGDLGRVMSAVMPKVRGRADGKQVNALVRERLAS
jgi:uncharacterized protein YqeY